MGQDRFVGTVRDDPLNGMPGDGEIDGTLIGSSISFIKRMPVTYSRVYYDDNVTRGPLIAGIGPHPIIHYVGDWFPAHHEFRGTWVISIDNRLTMGFWKANKEVIENTSRMRRCRYW
jgi:hypothetical protein